MESEIIKRIGGRVRSLRLNRGLSQDELSDGICSRQTISLLENGQHLPLVEFMQKIAERLSIPLYEIMVEETKELEAKIQLDVIRVYIETGDFNNALPLIQELQKQEEVLDYQRREVSICHAECLIRTGRADRAVHILNELLHRLEIERETDDHLMATLYDKLGTAHYFLSNMASAYAYYMRAYQLTIRFAQFDVTAARISYNLGMVCRHLNRHTEAVEFLSTAFSYFRKVSDRKRLAQTLFELGIAHRFRKEFDRAEECLKQSLAIYQSINMLSMALQVRQTYAYLVLGQIDTV